MATVGELGEFPFGPGDEAAAAPGQPLHQLDGRLAVQPGAQPDAQRRGGQRRQHHGVQQRYRRGRRGGVMYRLQHTDHPRPARAGEGTHLAGHLGAVDVGVGHHEYAVGPRLRARVRSDRVVVHVAHPVDREPPQSGQLRHLGQEPAVPGAPLADHPQRAAPAGVQPDEEVAGDRQCAVALK